MRFVRSVTQVQPSLRPRTSRTPPSRKRIRRKCWDDSTVLQRYNYGVRKTAVQQSGRIRQFLIDGRS